MDLEIRQTTGLKAEVHVDGGKWDVEFQDPFAPERESELRWYFEKHLEFPMLDTHRAKAASASVEEYGNTLFRKLFADHNLHAAFIKHHEAGRYKEDIQDMDEASTGLLHMRPVTFRYKTPESDGSKPLNYGLIAEEVNDVYPALVVRNKDGQIEAVQYHKLTPMLLNEFQKQHQHAEDQDEIISELQTTKRQQSEKIQSLETRLAALEALLSNKGATSER